MKELNHDYCYGTKYNVYRIAFLLILLLVGSLLCSPEYNTITLEKNNLKIDTIK